MNAYTIPATCGVAFKEWEGVCEALATGRQSVILRKGGIQEGPGGFVPEHDAFWLYPTLVHQAEQGLKPGTPAPPDTAQVTSGGMIGLSTLAVVKLVGRVDREERLKEFDNLHVWTAETVEKRFRYRTPGLWVLGVNVSRLDRPRAVPVTADHAGCKTWVRLEVAQPTVGLVPVVEADEFEARMEHLRFLLGTAGCSPR